MTLVKRMSVLILTVALTVIFAFSASAVVIRPDIPEESSFDYTDTRAISADRFDVEIKVNENNVIDVTEVITITYSQARHGIFRNIPLKGVINIYDSEQVTSKNYLMDITDVQVVDNKFSTSVDGSTLKVKIGDDSKSVSGTQQYYLKYKCRIPDDKIKSQDMFYWNFLPCDRAYRVKSSTLTVEMPKSFDKNNLEVLSGKYGAMSKNGFKSEVDGNKITATMTEGLDPFYGAAINITLPDGYFVGAYKEVNFGTVIVIGSLISAALAFILWLVFRNRTSVPIKTAMFVLLLTPFALSIIGMSKSMCDGRTFIISIVIAVLFALSSISAALNNEKRSSMSGMRKAAFIVFPLVIGIIALAILTVLLNHNLGIGIMMATIPVATLINLFLLMTSKNKSEVTI